MWTVAASGHVDDGEEWDIAAARETVEEIGVAVDVKEVGRFNFADDSDGKKVRQVLRVYEGTIESSTEFVLEPTEVDEIKWYELDELKAQMNHHPEQFTPSFIETINRFY
jgi:isopentenyl-diphosphate delta-isomerase